ncbi:M20/M25/M40 family metallo-hydrolase [Nocardioides dongxiaopingii]|uniref:M20/M25/M40 family metallo-hydrolase n=1 Tax=Nocardioides dongxiaopingii TaxID=2576036 RepID=UPI0010C76B17|nr:M20/M25/M40 family metallo-hydrolase [Nocardioides dongxiaopingii]
MRPPRSRAAVAAAIALGVVATLGGATGTVGTAAASPSVLSERDQPRPSGVRDEDSRRLQQAVRTRAIMKHLEQLQVVADRYGDRAAGQQGYAASSRYVEHVLREAGYQPRRQYFPFTYTRVNANTLTAGGDEVANHVLTGSPSTPAGGVAGELVAPADPLGCTAAAWSGIDATGKIALVNRGTCPFADKSRVAKAAGALGVVIWNNAPGEFTGGTLGETTDDLAPTTGINQDVGQALVADLAAGPVQATLDLDILVEERQTWNVVAETRRGRSGNVVMAGAHLDGVQDGAGINDNGSGSATLLETAVQLKKMEGRLRNKVRFAWWGAEELGLLGSTHYVNDLVENRPAALDDIATYLNYDMVGSPNYIVGVYDADESSFEASAPVPAGSIETERAYRRYFRAVGQPVVDTAFSGRSDYQAFIANGVAAGGLFSGGDGVKTPEQARLFGGTAGITYDPNYHTPADDLANVNRRSVTIMSDAIAHMTIRLGKSTAVIDVPGGRSTPKRVVVPRTDEPRR